MSHELARGRERPLSPDVILEPESLDTGVRPKKATPVLRGSEFQRPRDIDELSEIIRQEDPLHLNLLSKAIPHKHSYGHLLYMGTTDSGKSTCINHLLKDVLSLVGRGYGQRVFVWDYKRTARRFLEGLPLTVPVFYLDPADNRSHGIDWPNEINSRPAAMQFARDILHTEADPKGHNHAFIVNARSTLFQVVRTFQKFAPKTWDLIDVVYACTREKYLKKVLKKTERGRAMSKTIFKTRGQKGGVYFSLEEFAFNFGPIAAATSRIPPERRITLHDWLKTEGVLVLGHHEDYPDSLGPFQAWVFGNLSRRLLGGPDIPHDGTERTTFVLDEVRNAPFGRHVNKLANSGRSKGASIIAGIGDMAGLKDALGAEKASEFVGMCKTKVFLRMDGEAAEWSAKYFGKQLRMIHKFSESESLAHAMGFSRGAQWGWNGSSYSSSQSQGTNESTTYTPGVSNSYEAAERAAVYESEFRGLTPPRNEGDRGLVVRAIISVENLAWKECATHLDRQIIPRRDGTTDFEPRDDAEFDFDDGWTDEDYLRLGLAPNTTSPPEASPPAKGPQSTFSRAFAPRPKTSESHEEVREDPARDAKDSGIHFDEGELLEFDFSEE